MRERITISSVMNFCTRELLFPARAGAAEFFAFFLFPWLRRTLFMRDGISPAALNGERWQKF
jgi:hypothetical protein